MENSEQTSMTRPVMKVVSRNFFVVLDVGWSTVLLERRHRAFPLSLQSRTRMIFEHVEVRITFSVTRLKEIRWKDNFTSESVLNAQFG